MVLPNFLMIGAPKSGTSSIYNYLNQHPEIFMCPEKEPHFFILNDSPPNFNGPGDADRFSNAVYRFQDYENLFADVTGEIAIGEASTTYLSNESAPARIKSTIPDARLLAILRNPAEVGFSSYCHLIRDGDEYLPTFETALAQENQRISNHWEGIWHYKARGFYAKQLERYFDLFDRKQIKVLVYEDLENIHQVLKEIFTFLDVDPSFKVDTTKKFNVSKIPRSKFLNQLVLKENAIKSIGKYILPSEIRKGIAVRVKNWNFKKDLSSQLKLSPETKKQLIEEYRQDIESLQNIIDRDLSAWLES